MRRLSERDWKSPGACSRGSGTGADRSRTALDGFVLGEAWAQGTAYDFGLIEGERGRLLGGCGLNTLNRDNRFANLGYWVRSSRTRQGLATAATRFVAAFGFTEPALGRIEIVVATGNTASQRVAEKVGAVREGILRNRLVVRDQVYDAVMYSLIPQDVMAPGKWEKP